MFRLGLRSVLAVAAIGALATQANAATSFASRTITTQLSSDGPQVIHLADVDGDGLDDLLAVDRDADRLIIFLNQGDGQFDGGTVLPTGAGPLAVATGDFNDDGDLDILTVNSIAGTVSVFLANEDGEFDPGARIDSVVGPAVLGVAVADFNDDDIDDIAVLSPDRVYVMRSNENGSFTLFPGGSFSSRSSNASSFAIAAANIDAGASPDLVVSNRDDGQIAVFLASGPGTFVLSDGGFLAVGNSVSGIVVADVDGDGDNDIIGVDDSGDLGALTQELKLFRNQNRTGRFEQRETITAEEEPFAITRLDVDGDGRVDLAVTTRVSAQISLLCQPSDTCNLLFQGPLEAGLWRPTAAVPGLNLSPGQVAIVSGRLNDDNLDDLVALSSDLRTIGIFLNQSTAGTPVPTVPGDTPTPGPSATPTATPTPAPTFTPTPIPTVPLGRCELALTAVLPSSVDPTAIVVADFDLDGQRDIAVADRSGGRIIIYYGVLTGGGTTGNTCERLDLVRGQTIAGFDNPVDLAVADFDRDSRPDLVVLDARGLTPVFGSGSRAAAFALGPTLAAGGQPARLAIADFNRDGVPDVLVTDSLAGATRVNFFFGVAGRDNPFNGQACPFNVGKRSDRVIATDLNRTARADFAIASPQTNDISVFVRNVDRPATCATVGTAFAAIAPISLDGPSLGLDVGNFDLADAVPDLVVAARRPQAAPQVQLHLGQPLGAGVRYLRGPVLGDGGIPLTDPIEIAVGDVNRDARQDLVVLDSGRTNNVIVYLGGSDGRLNAPLLPESSLGGGAPANRLARALAVADIDGDARDDIIVAHSDGVLTFFLSSDPPPPPPTPTPADTATPTPVLSATPTLTPIPTITLTPTQTRRPTASHTPEPTATKRGVITLDGTGCALTPESRHGPSVLWPVALGIGLGLMRRRRR